jgi:hypothetical protein
MNCLTVFASAIRRWRQAIKSWPIYSGSAGSDPPPQLAAAGGEAGVSQSSVVKFAQKMGFKGFPGAEAGAERSAGQRPDPQSVPVHNQIRGDDPLRLVGEN